MLYFISTPIGNPDDITIRALKVLAEADVIFAEDTRSLGKLLLFHSISGKSIKSFYKDQEMEVSYDIAEMAQQQNVVIVSEAGTPLVSDPGYLLSHILVKQNIPFTVLPGPSAPITALLHSGFNPKQWMFTGFLPKKPGDVKKKLQEFQSLKEISKDLVIIFFESPHRIQKTLSLIAEHYPQAQLAVSRELTKKYEETRRGTAHELINYDYKGEITVCLS